MEKSVRIHCNNCSHETNHVVRATDTVVSEDKDYEGGPVGEKDTFEILQCLGCEERSIRRTFEHDAYGKGIPEFYPPRISRRTPLWKGKLPKQILAVVEEVYRALQNDSPRLATIGARTIIDLVILDKVGDIGTFVEKLTALEKQGYVGRKNREFVAAVLEAGSAAAHRGIAPQVNELNRVMDIVESLLESVYVLEELAQHLRQTTPARPSRGKPINRS